MTSSSSTAPPLFEHVQGRLSEGPLRRSSEEMKALDSSMNSEGKKRALEEGDAGVEDGIVCAITYHENIYESGKVHKFKRTKGPVEVFWPQHDNSVHQPHSKDTGQA